MASLCNIGLHSSEDPQSLVCKQGVSISVVFIQKISVNLIKSQSIKMLCQTQSIQPCSFRFSKKPVRIHSGERKPLCQLPVCMKIHIHILFTS